ncbi:MAG: class I SAM-dependent methyltransferase [Thermoanaerobaculia bacterium]
MSERDESTPLRCTRCRGSLVRDGGDLRCGSCGANWPIEHGIADFAEGAYYDQYEPGTELAPEHVAGLRLELEGTRRRIESYYLPHLVAGETTPLRVLDCGCGNGLSVDLFAAAGIEGWGNDVSALRKWQWRERAHRERLVVASALDLPFDDGWFDAVISSGVIEHIGVDERMAERYEVRPRATRDEERTSFLRELLRVTRPGGQVWIDCPNGSFPIDFWHSGTAGGARFHSLSEGFLPSWREIRRLARAAGARGTITAESPRNRLAFEQVGRHWYGRLFRIPVEGLFAMMSARPFAFLRATPLNPYLVVRIES